MTPDEQAARRLAHAERRWLADARARLSTHPTAPPTRAIRATRAARPTPTHPEADR
ncbi:hypothetical protein GUY44_08560 [Pimelobacter simplex]|uniref:Uncharacterized protein n=1 Tax=Nocardioides simplex TaxID=2045 RepID=A0A0C5X9T7_NOCSI|nr:hypothetical protein [Pimelobacter simplex]AJR17990.1 hypothetical protein KR76_00008 [Pimelobacter simplex]MCG8150528.1 hypothetical protein [Pimelobacter simplex]GEB15049.1 hypothetical protein NSI01_33640 [Pimelobacter simplex]SFM87126.1 hypothetical protein SAMN05421671_3888 [Pimelobacter simplex]